MHHKTLKLLFILATVCMMSSCMFVSTKAQFKLLKPVDDEKVLLFKQKVNAHYDSLPKAKKVLNDALDDVFLESNIKVIEDSTAIAVSSSYIQIGEVTGSAHLDDKNWLLYKMKQKAILEGANQIVILKSSVYDHSGSIWRLIFRSYNENNPPVKRIYYVGKAVYVKP